MKKILLLLSLCIGICCLSEAQITVTSPASGATITNCSNFIIYYTSSAYVANGRAALYENGTLVTTFPGTLQTYSSNSVSLSSVTPGSNYSVKVYDQYNPSNFGWSATFSILSVAAPVAAAATSVGSGTFTPQWSMISGADPRLDISTTSDFSTFLYPFNDISGYYPNYPIYGSGINPGTTYYYRVRAAIGSCVSANSNYISVLTLPAAPTLLAATDVTGTSLTIGWGAVASATQYSFELSTSSSFTTFTTDNTSSLSVAKSGLTLNGQYYMRVRAYNASGYSSYSNTISITLIAPPTAMTATNITTSSFDATFYYFESFGYRFLDVSTDINFSTFVSGNNNRYVSGGNYASVTGLQSNTTYYYRYRGVNGAATTANSSVITVLTLPDAPVASNPTNVQGNSFTANWQAVAGINEYRIDIASNSGFSPLLVTNQTVVGATAYNVTSLTPNTTYYYRVRAKNPTGSSANSNVIGPFYTAALPPAIQAPTGITLNSFNANWSASTGATSYQIDISTSSSFSTSLSGYPYSTGNVTTYQVTGLNPCTTYYYRVLAANPAASAYSTTLSALTAPAAPVIPTPDNTDSNVAATKIMATSFTANWLPVTGCLNINYYIDISTVSSFASFFGGYNNYSVSGSNTSLDLSSIGTTTYYYRVRAANSNGTTSSPSSNVWTVTLGNITPIANAATNVGSSAFIANWSSINGTSGYLLDVSTSNSFASFLTGYQSHYINATQLSITGLNVSTTYYYRLRSITTSGYSAYSSIQSLTTTSSGPPGGRIGSIDVITAIENPDNSNLNDLQAHIFPNPATDRVTILLPQMLNMQSIQTNVKDMYGRSIVLPMTYADKSLEVDITSLPGGLYVFSISFDKSKFIAKVLKR